MSNSSWLRSNSKYGEYYQQGSYINNGVVKDRHSPEKNGGKYVGSSYSNQNINLSVPRAYGHGNNTQPLARDQTYNPTVYGAYGNGYV